MAGFLLAALPILTLGLGGVETAHWSGLRQTLSLALVEAARAGATRQARPHAIAQAFEHGLRMAYPDPRAAGRALHERRAVLGVPWHIRIAQPSPDAFLDHADPELRGQRDHPGQPLIRNDYQERQQARRLAQGWPAGRGPRSGLTIHEANTLVLELSWPHRPMLPGMAAIVRVLAPLAGDPAQARLMSAGYLPFRRRVSIAMHSHPAAWPDLPDGRVTHGAASIPPGWAPGSPEWNDGHGTAGPPPANDGAITPATPGEGPAAPDMEPESSQPPDPGMIEDTEGRAGNTGGNPDAEPGPADCGPVP